MFTRFAIAILAFAPFLSLANSEPAEASNVDITDVVGGACVPDSATIRAGIHETRGFGIGFSGSSTGKIRLLCPYHLTSEANGAKIGLTVMSVIDQDGMEVGTRVRANLHRAALGSNVAVTIGTCDSNTSTLTGPHNMACFLPSYTAKINESYWWEILIERTNPRLNVEFLAVGMRYYP